MKYEEGETMMDENFIPVRRSNIPAPDDYDEGDIDAVCRDAQVREVLARESVISIMIVFKDGSAIEYAKDCTCGEPSAPEL